MRTTFTPQTATESAEQGVALINAMARALVDEAASWGIVVRIEPEHDLQDRAMGHYGLKVDVYPGATLRKAIDAEKRAAEEAAK